MTDYRRIYHPGAVYFFTVVTHERRPFLTTPMARKLLRDAFQTARARADFSFLAFCLLPDHFHCLMCLPEGDTNYSLRWSHVKGEFTRAYLAQGSPQGMVTRSRKKKGEAGVWQRRFWEHTIRDEADFENHANYIHYNPLKHGYVEQVRDWPWSSFHRYVKLGWIDPEWGTEEPSGCANLFNQVE